jgi:uncharacterized protein (TIGR02217 family)
MTATFLETPRFDVNISYGSKGGPNFNTTVFDGHGGIEQRGINWATAKGKWNVSQGIRDTTDMDLIRALFYAVNGKAIGFRFKDWGDFQMTTENATPVADGVNRVFKMQKTYTSGALSYVRRIFKPVSGSILVYDNGTLRAEGGATNQYTIDYTTGKITFGTAIVPVNTHIITVTGEYDLPVRFDTDALDVAQDSFQTETWSSIPLVELLLTDS